MAKIIITKISENAWYEYTKAEDDTEKSKGELFYQLPGKPKYLYVSEWSEDGKLLGYWKEV